MVTPSTSPLLRDALVGKLLPCSWHMEAAMKRDKVVTWARLRPPNPKDSLLHNDTHLH